MQKTKRGLAALLLFLALGAFAAGGASAAATTTAAKWFTGPGPGTELTSSKPITAALKSSVFTLKDPTDGIELSATGISCQSCTIENKEVTGHPGKVAFGGGKLLFTGVTVLKPAHCTIESEAGVENQIITKPLNVHADFMNGATAVQQFIPQTGTTFARFFLQASGVCPLAMLYTVTGSLFANSVNATGTFKASQEVATSPAIQTADGGSLGVWEPTGTVAFSIGGTEFAVK